MADMQRTPQERADDKAEMEAMEDSGPKYPWGLEIHLEQEELDKLGGSLENKSAGDVCTFTAKALVTRTSARDELDGDGVEHSVHLQITDMEISGVNDEDKTTGNTAAKAAIALYSKG